MKIIKILIILFMCLSFISCSGSGGGSPEISSVNAPASIPVADPTEEPATQLPPAQPPVTSPPVSPPASPAIDSPKIALMSGEVQLIKTPNPNGHTEFLASINKTKSGDIIRMAMFHLTDTDVINSLIAAKNRGVTVKVILDSASLAAPNFKLGFEKLKSGGVDVRESTSAFSISHQKSMTVNIQKPLSLQSI